MKKTTFRVLNGNLNLFTYAPVLTVVKVVTFLTLVTEVTKNTVFVVHKIVTKLKKLKY